MVEGLAVTAVTAQDEEETITAVHLVVVHHATIHDLRHRKSVQLTYA